MSDEHEQHPIDAVLDDVKPESLERAAERFAHASTTLRTMAAHQAGRRDKGQGTVGSQAVALWLPYVEHALTLDTDEAERYLFAALHATAPFARAARLADARTGPGTALTGGSRSGGVVGLVDGTATDVHTPVSGADEGGKGE